MTGNSNNALALTGLCLFFILVVDASQDKNCDCQGPTNFYKEIGCTPVFKNQDDCCPIRYDCGVLSNLTDNQCLISGHVYTSGEHVRNEDANPCDWCSCHVSSYGGSHQTRKFVAEFRCFLPMCGQPRLRDRSCHWVYTDDCCGGIEVCPEEDGSLPTCIVDGKTYKGGEFFVPSAEPEKRCYCGNGYTGENVKPYCTSPGHTWCRNVIRDQRKIRSCAPIYHFGKSPQTDCNEGFRCPTSTDVVSEPTNETSNETKNGTNEPEDLDMLCKFGNLTIRVGEELNENAGSCMKCTCEVPPILTCQQEITDKECKALNHS